MKNNWNVTYEVVTPESAAECEAEEQGFEHGDASFRAAMSTFGDYAESADSWPVEGSVRWFDGPSEENFSDGSYKRLSLHVPPQITPSSRKRLARYLGLKVGR